MDVVVKELSPGLSRDYFDFFDNRAFSDNPPYRCYCQMYQMSKEQQGLACESAGETDMGLVSKNAAQQQIDSGALRGYLAYVDGLAVGWCNANDRASFPSDPCCDVLFHSPIPKRDMAVVCFEIDPEFRGCGISTALLNRVISDARDSGFVSVVSFPVIRDERYEWDCAGPVHMYEKAGFKKITEHSGTRIMRKEL